MSTAQTGIDTVAALQESELRLRQILDNTTAVVYVKDREGHNLMINRQFERLFGLREADVVGRSDADIFPSDVAAAFRANDLRVFETLEPSEFEERVQLPDGERIYLSLKFPLFNTEGEAYAVCGMSRDITERKRMEGALRNVALGVSAATGDDVFQAIVHYLAESLGVDFAFIGQLIDGGRNRLKTLAIWHAGNIVDNIEYDLAGTPCQMVVGKEFQFITEGVQHLYPGDNMLSEFGFEGYAGYPLFDSAGAPLGLIAVTQRRALTERDVTESMLKIFSVRAAAELERMRAEEARRKSDDRLRATVEAALDCIIGMDSAGNIIEFNPAAERCFGYRRDEVLGRSLAETLIPERIRPAHHAGLLRYHDSRGGPFIGRRVEVQAMRADGDEFPAELTISEAQGPEGDIFIGYLRDISERKQAEVAREQLEAQLRQAQKMEAIGHLSGGIAHDFNNILTGIMGYVVLAEEWAEEHGDPKLTRYLERVQQSGQRARDLIRQMLTFSRGQRGEPQALALAPLINESVKLLGSTLPATIELATELDADLAPVMIDPVHVEQVLMNLCINARDAIQGTGRIGVGLRRVRHSGEVCASCRQRVDGEFVELSVCDTGVGISPENLDRIFEPFFTTKEVGKGSGMGLSTVHGIAHEYGAHVLVDSVSGEGTTFRVLFTPLARNEPRGDVSVAESYQRVDSAGLRGRVLVVDDDETVGDFMQDLLESWGLSVTLVRDGEAGRAAFEGEPTGFDAAIFDQTMPRMTGMELARHVLRRRPDFPVILYTGYSEHVSEANARSAGARELLRKPVDTPRLFELLRELLPDSAR